MTTVFIVINALITITALILCIRAWKGLRAVSKSKSRAGYKHSALERRREALELATKAWLYSVEHGFTYAGRREKEVMERLEREVATLENELFGTAEEVTPKVETPKRQPVAKVEFVGDEFFPDCYIITCSFCGWSWWGRSAQTAVEKSVEHEGTHV